MVREDADLVSAEICWAAQMLELACRIGQARQSVGFERDLHQVPAPQRAELATELKPLIEQQREMWLSRSRPGGLDDSIARLELTLEQLET
jgi:hypothetical protein